MQYTDEEREALGEYLEMITQAALALNGLVTNMALWMNIDGGRTFAGIATDISSHIVPLNSHIGSLNKEFRDSKPAV